MGNKDEEKLPNGELIVYQGQGRGVRYIPAREQSQSTDKRPIGHKEPVELSAMLYEQFAEADKLEATIKKNLEILGYGE